ncbi:MAG TPA: sulfocyanin-like copper-binding protein [Gaiellaceae bacterium]|nr:sulfocyanin-like copper-binding protein [Gaiellaceae bacterium]
MYGDADSEVEMAYYFWVLRSGDETILVDTGFDPAAGARQGRTLVCPPVDALRRMCDAAPMDAPMAGRVAVAGLVTALAVASTASASSGPGRYLSWDAGRRVAHLTLLAGLGTGNNGFNFDGYGRGELLVRVPVGWRVIVDCENRGGGRHSCAVVRGALAVTPAFAGAATPQPLVGLSPGAKASFSFVASRVGTFRLASLVAGQEQARMYAVLDVTHGGLPAITARRGP